MIKDKIVFVMIACVGYRGIFNVVIVVQVGVPVCQALLAYGKQQYDEVRTLYDDVYHQVFKLHIHNDMYSHSIYCTSPNTVYRIYSICEIRKSRINYLNITQIRLL